MKRLPSLFTTVAQKGHDLRSSSSSHITRIYSGFQSLELNGQSKTYHAFKAVGLCGICLSSLFTLNVEGVIASGIGLGDEITYLEKLPPHLIGSPTKDISYK